MQVQVLSYFVLIIYKINLIFIFLFLIYNKKVNYKKV